MLTFFGGYWSESYVANDVNDEENEDFCDAYFAHSASNDYGAKCVALDSRVCDAGGAPCSVYDFEFDSGCEYACRVDMVVKLDTACSKNMSGDIRRLDPSTLTVRDVRIKGFNNSVSTAATVGENEDGKEELHVASMPSHLALLCAHEYTKEGATVLFPEDGAVIRLTPEEQKHLRRFISPFPTVKKLVVRNRTYEVDNGVCSPLHAVKCDEARVAQFGDADEEGYSSTASRYFNSKVHVSNAEERVLATLLTGLTFQDVYSMARHGSVEGLPRDLTISALNSFEHRYGRNPDPVQLSTPNLAGNTKGYMAPSPQLTHRGQRVEADFFECEFNDPSSALLQSAEALSAARKRLGKLPSHGGAVAAFVSVDAYTGAVHGRLVANLKAPVQHVRWVHQQYALCGCQIELFAADQGILTQSLFRVSDPEVQGYLREHGIRNECGEAYNHNHGTSHIERVIRTIKELQRFATLYILHNPNFPTMGFTKLQILKLWGELFYWALAVINLKPSPADLTKTKCEMFLGMKPDLREVRLLPIFASVMVLRRTALDELHSTQGYWQQGLYVGPSLSVRGAVRVAVVTKGKFVIVTSTDIKAVTDGGARTPYTRVDAVVPSMIHEYDPPVYGPIHYHVSPVAMPDPIPSPVPVDAPVPGTATGPAVLCDGDVDVRVVRVPTPACPAVAPSVPVRTVDRPAVVLRSPVRGKVVPPKRVRGMMPIGGNLNSDGVTVEPGVSLSSSGADASAVSGVVNAGDGEHGTVSKRARRKARALEAVHVDPSSQQPRRAAPAQYDPCKTTRTERMRKRNNPEHVTSAAALMEEYPSAALEECCYVDWSKHVDDTYYWCLATGAFLTITDYVAGKHELPPDSDCAEECYRAVTENVPKSFSAALKDPVWAEPARAELAQLTVNTNCIVECDQQIAAENIRAGAEVLRLLAVYEEKVKEGVLVRKVRLVADGRRHLKHGPTYAATPSREDLLLLLHIFATDDIDYFFLDEVRAFLSANRQDGHVTYAKLTGDSKLYQILKALYGMKTASRDHQVSVRDRLTALGFKPLKICPSIYKYYDDDGDFMILVLVYVDDFIFGGTCNKRVLQMITKFRLVANTSEPEMNATSMLGLEVVRDKSKRLVFVTMVKKIRELCDLFPDAALKKKNVPMPTTGYIVKDYEFDTMPDHKSAFLRRDGIESYMSIVGLLIWIQGVRMDIMFVVLYLSWHTKAPRQHHLDMAYYCIGYLHTTIEFPLVLGGNYPLKVVGYSDASLATGPQGRSVTANITRLNEHAGAISAKASASHTVVLSSYEAELHGATNMIKSEARVSNTLQDMGVDVVRPSLLHSDNLAMINFVKGEGVAKGVRHMEMRMWYTREEYSKGKFELVHMPGKDIPTDKLTKLGSVVEHRIFTRNILGHNLVGPDFMNSVGD
jgi:hypothetical protein